MIRQVLDAPARPWTTAAVLSCAAVAEALRMRPDSFLVPLTALLATVCSAWRHSRPVLARVSIGSALLNSLVWPQMFMSVALAGLLGFYALSRNRVHHPVTLAVCGTVGAILVNIGQIKAGAYDLTGLPLEYTRGVVPYLTDSFVVAVAIVTAVSIGDAVRSREEMRHERLAAQARRIATERQRAAEAERARITRELHDVVAHSVSLIAVQAETATYTVADLGPEGRENLQQIAESARTALSELRQILDVLRDRTGERASTSPQPTLERLDELIEQHRAAGGEVVLRRTGGPEPVPATVGLAAFRIVQEALTNTRKHAPGARAVVEIGRHPDRVTVRIEDDGAHGVGKPGSGGRAPRRLSTGSGTGHGLAGMLERATLLNGRLSAGPRPSGGFVVDAVLPVEQTRTPEDRSEIWEGVATG
ncbi:sensor histidine kinase [Streptomyces sp. NRRL S-474]|uniref:sensor histidine kinase n=2 Tax=unclassified Streptomyces TaxID=2593676 RepID=UPI00131B1915|nr:histidine kinase [Streptomyces sp. NRRL S-474]